MRKLILSLIIAAILFLSNASGVYAADATLSCSNSSCTPATSLALFSPSDMWYPGKEVTKTVRITNTHSSAQTVGTRAENTDTTGMLDSVILLTIKRQSDNATLYSGTLSGFYNGGELSLSTIGSTHDDTISFTLLLPTSVDNTHQDTTTVFDLVLGFFPESTKPGSSSDTNGGSGTGSSSQGNGTAAQTIVQFIKYFTPGTLTEVLGQEDTINSGVSTRSAAVFPLEPILGSSLSCEQCDWWPFILLELMILICLVLIGRRREWSRKHYFALVVLLGILIQVLFWWWSRSCSSSNWFCRYFWLLNTMAVSIFSLFYKKKG